MLTSHWRSVILFLACMCCVCFTQGITVTKYNTLHVTRSRTVSTSTHFTTLKTVVYRSQSGVYTEAVTSKPQSIGKQFKDEILNKHNELRDRHGVPRLSWDSNLADKAQEFASQYVCNGYLKHSNLPYGENLALGYNTTAAVLAWYNEIHLYNFSDPQFSDKTGHFTQLVWKNSSRLGCAFIKCGQYYDQYTACEYDPPGNIIGDFKENVLPPNDTTN